MIDTALDPLHHVRTISQAADRAAQRRVMTMLQNLRTASFREILEEAGAHYLRQVAGESYMHANGFAKLSLPRIGSSESRLRVHIWSKDTSAPGWPYDIHNHRWSLVSKVVAGKIRQQKYRCLPQVERIDDFDELRSARIKATHYIHRQTSPEVGYTFERIGPARLQAVAGEFLDAGDVYSLAPEVLHDIHLASDYSATLVVEMPPTLRAETDVYSTRAIHSGIELDPVRFTPREVSQHISQLLLRL